MRLRHPLKETMRAMNDVKLREAMLGTLEFFPMLPTQFIEIQTCVYKQAWHHFVNLHFCYDLLHGEDESSLNTYCKTQNIAPASQCPNRHVFYPTIRGSILPLEDRSFQEQNLSYGHRATWGRN